jgi:prepilin peptidase dependent protein B
MRCQWANSELSVMLASNRQKGLTLVELLISMALGMVAISGLVSFIGYGLGVNATVINKSQLSEETETIMDFIASEVMRAGYSGNTIATVQDPTANPSLFNNSIVVSRHPDEALNTCILFSYDFDSDGTVDSLGVNEEFGFRLRSGEVQIRQLGAPCNSDTDWSAINNFQTTEINALSFILSPLEINSVTRTKIDINIQSQSKTSPRFTTNLTRNFIVRNYD